MCIRDRGNARRPTINTNPQGSALNRQRVTLSILDSRTQTDFTGQMAAKPSKKINYNRAWAEARELVRRHRRSLSIGLALMLVNRGAGFVIPGSSKFFLDNVIGKHRADLLVPLAIGAAVAVIIQAITTYALSQIVSIAAQRAISDMREDVQSH